jgi:hypothetical protein
LLVTTRKCVAGVSFLSFQSGEKKKKKKRRDKKKSMKGKDISSFLQRAMGQAVH